MTAQAGQKFLLRGLLNSFGDDREAKALGQSNDHAGNRRVVRVDKHIADETLIDLQLIKRQTFQIRQRGITRTEIVKGEADAKTLQGHHFFDGIFHVIDQQALRQFELQPLRVGSGPFEDVLNLLHEVTVEKLPRTDVDRQHQTRHFGAGCPSGQLDAGRFQHPVADVQDHAGFFGQRDELRR